MDVEILARLQFALTIMFHYIYPPLSIGLGVIIVITEALYLKTRSPFYLASAKFWVRIFALTFAIGVATGLVMEFEFGTNWATYSRYVGDVFGSALAAEGVFAFFLESGFLAILLFGWDRVGPKLHFFASLMVCLGAHFSAVWIVVANSWMQTPAGYHIVGEGLNARAEITEFWALVFNPSSMTRLAHTIFGAWLAAAFLVISIAAYYMLKGRHQNFAKSSMRVALSVASVSLVLQLVTGHTSAQIVAEHQPAKLAAMEGVYTTQTHAPLYMFGVPNNDEGRVEYGISVPSMLSWLALGSFDAEVTGLDAFPREDWPNTAIVFQSYHIMVSLWGVMVATVLLALWAYRRGTLSRSPWILRLLVASAFFPQVANQLGWVTAEAGRYPWMVYNLLRISDGLSKAVSANQVLASIILFGLVYSLLFVLFVFLLDHKIKAGPVAVDEEGPYHMAQQVLRKGN